MWNHCHMIVAQILKYPVVFTAIEKCCRVFKTTKMGFSCFPMASSQLSSRKILRSARSCALESIFIFASELLLTCRNKSLLFSRAEFISLLIMSYNWIIWLIRAFLPLTFYGNKNIKYTVLSICRMFHNCFFPQ